MFAEQINFAEYNFSMYFKQQNISYKRICTICVRVWKLISLLNIKK